MRKLVFGIHRKPSAVISRGRLDIRYFLRRWGVRAAFTLLLLSGLLVGTLSFGSLSKETLGQLDLLFTTNLPGRLSDGALSAFCASFSSDFLFFIASFLMGLSVWGAALLPVIAFFKGFGIGITAAYLISSYGLRGLGFYVVVLLPGVFVFSIVLVYELALSLGIFRRMCSVLFRRGRYGFADSFRSFLHGSARYLILTFGASVLDVVLWALFGGLFGIK